MYFPKVIITFLVVICVCSLSAQQHLLLKKPGKIKYYIYQPGSEIIFKTIKGKSKVIGLIYDITDSSIIINGTNEVLLDQIQKIYRERGMVRVTQYATRIAGVGYFALDVVNRTLNNEYPIVHKSTLITSASMVGFSYLLYPFRKKSCIINKPWILQVLDFSF